MAGPSFNEFSLELPIDAAQVVERAAQDNWVCGVDLGRFKETMETATTHTRQRASQPARDRADTGAAQSQHRMNRLGYQASPEEALIFERSIQGRVGSSLPPLDVELTDAAQAWGEELVRTQVEGFPEVSENEVVRHFTRLSLKNYSIDVGLYPLGSCTMKYNPKINEELAKIENFANLHPLWPEKFLKPAMAVQNRTEDLLAKVTGLEAVTLLPIAGAHGEYTGLKVIQAYHRKKGNTQKTKILIPESAHGTNPATCSMLGYEVVSIPANESGIVELSDIEPLIDDSIAGIMMTNPNTLGLFETHIKEISDRIHAVDGLFYMDGANFNAILGVALPADLGVDIMHINLHKTFSTPHGGGGPGCGAVAAVKSLSEFMPTPWVKESGYVYEDENSIGRIGGYFGNFSIQLRALAYLLSIGTAPGGKSLYLKEMAEAAVLNANYIRKRLESSFKIPFNKTCMHEFCMSDEIQNEFGIKTLDIAKRLIDYGYHPMTVYFPLVVHGAMLIEPHGK